MENKLSKLANIKNSTLSDSERNLMRASLNHYVSLNPITPRVSILHMGIQHGLRIALSSSLFVVLVCGSISVVASNSLPGDPLYSFKVNVNEEVKGAFLKTPTAKIAWQKARIETRLDEIKVLAQNKTLTKEKQIVIEQALDSHVTELNKELTTLNAEDPTKALTETTNLEQSLQTQKETLTNTLPVDITAVDKASTLQTIDNTIQKMNAQEVKMTGVPIIPIVIDPTAPPVILDPKTTPSTTPDTTKPLVPTNPTPKPTTPSGP